MYGFETTLMLPLRCAAAGYSGPAFYPSDVAEALASVPERRVLVTTPLQMRAQLGAGAPVPALEAVISATAPLAAELAAQAEAAWGTRVLEIYGATEVGSIASRRTLEGDGWRPYRGVRLAIEERNALVTVPGLPAPVPLADEVEWCGHGRFRLLGRRADMVKRAGKRASLAGLNRILNEIEGVQDGVFVAPEDLDHNPAARLAAYVVAPTRSPEQIVAALRERVEAAFLPRPVVMLPELPRDTVGKLSRRALDALRQRPA
jgi:acyl-coenzyme A synthetase/AMP-(fatty) acid ligase